MILDLRNRQIGLRWSRTTKCSQRYQIELFCLAFFQLSNSRKQRYVRPECFLHGHRIFVAEHVMPVFVLKCFSKCINIHYIYIYIILYLNVFRNAFRNVSLRMKQTRKYTQIHSKTKFDFVIHAKPHPQPPYQASAWSYRYGQGLAPARGPQTKLLCHPG